LSLARAQRENIVLDRLLTNIIERTSRTPSSSRATPSSEGALGRNVEFDFRFDDEILRIYLGQGGTSGAIIVLGYAAKDDDGFLKAHGVFTPDLILSFLLGEISFDEFKSMFKDAKIAPGK
jgi:hypothetical protein